MAETEFGQVRAEASRDLSRFNGFLGISSAPTPLHHIAFALLIGVLAAIGALVDPADRAEGGEVFWRTVYWGSFVILGILLALRDRKRASDLPAGLHGYTAEIRLRVELEPDGFRGYRRRMANADRVMGAGLVALGLLSLGGGLVFSWWWPAPKFSLLVVFIGLVWIWGSQERKYAARWLEHLDETAPIGSPAGWLRDEHGYLRWWDGYKWTLAFAPGEAERSRHAPSVPRGVSQ